MHAQPVRPVKGAAHPCASPAIFPPSHPSATEQLSGVPCTRSSSEPRRGLRTHAPAPPSSRHLLSSSCQACYSAVWHAVRPTREGGCAPMRQPRHLTAICYRAAVRHATQLSGMRSVRPVKGAAHPCASPAILPPSATSSGQACHARAVRTMVQPAKGAARPCAGPVIFAAVCCRAAVWRVTHECGPSDP